MRRSSSLHSIDDNIERKISNEKYQDVKAVADDIGSVVSVAANIDAVINAESNASSALAAKIAAEAARDIAIAAQNDATISASEALQAEYTAIAAQMTADSYATEAIDVPVKIYTSNGDGTYTVTDTLPIEYSSKHWSSKADLTVNNIKTNQIVNAHTIGAVTDDHLDTLINISHSSGVISGCDLTDNGDGTVSITAGEALIRDSANELATIYSVVVPATASLPLTVDITNYLYVDYNAGNPIWVATTIQSDINCIDKCLGYIVYKSTDGHLDLLDDRGHSVDVSRKTRALFRAFGRFIHVEGGSTLYNPSGLYIGVTAGAFFYTVTRVDHTAFDTSVAGTANENTFEYFYRNGAGGWNVVYDQKTVSNVYYDNDTGTLQLIGTAKFGVHWVYMMNNDPSHLAVVYGQAQYNTVAEAAVATPPSQIPPSIEGLGVLIGFVTVQQGVASIVNTYSAFTTTFAASQAVDHNGLAGLQGGAANEYYHLSAAEYADLDNADTLDTYHAIDFPRKIEDTTISGNWNFTGVPTFNSTMWDNGYVDHYIFRGEIDTTVGNLDGYYEDGEGLEILEITPSANSQNWLIVGKLFVVGGTTYDVVDFSLGVRSNILPDLDYVLTYSAFETTSSQRFVPVVWMDETTGKIRLVFKCISTTIYGSVEVDFKVYKRDVNQDTVILNNHVVTTTPPTGFIEYQGTKYMDVSNNGAIIEYPSTSEVRSGVNKFWHAGNDGSGSTLDSDLLDGVQGSGYQATLARGFPEYGVTPTYDFNTADDRNYVPVTISGDWVNGPLGAGLTTYAAVMVGYDRFFDAGAGYVQIIYQYGDSYIRYGSGVVGSRAWSSWSRQLTTADEGILDAGTLDSLDSTQFLRSDTSDIADALIRFDGGITINNTVGVQSTGSTSYTRYSGGLSGDGATMILGGSAHATLPSEGQLRVGTSSKISWNNTDVTISTPLSIIGGVSADTLRYTRSFELATDTDLNTVDGITYPSGFYDIQITTLTGTNSPATGWFYLEVQRHTNANGFCRQVLTTLDGLPYKWMRNQQGGTWGNWYKVWTELSDGTGSGLDADMVDGKHVGTSGNVIPVLDGLNSWSKAQRGTITTEDNAIDFNTTNNFSLTATAANITATNVASCVGQSGVIEIASAENITGWGTEFTFSDGFGNWSAANAPSVSGTEVLAYFVINATTIRIGRVQ